MSVRDSMGELITRTRTLIADPDDNSGTTVLTFTNQQIQDALDYWREEQRWVALRPMPTFQPGGQILYLDYYHDAQNWEADVQLQDLTYQTITATVSELLVGHWQFASQPAGIGVRATGKTYDLYASAADLLGEWAATLKLRYALHAEDITEQRQQQMSNILTLAETYRQRALPHTSRMYQGDAAPDQDGGGVTYPNIGRGT